MRPATQSQLTEKLFLQQVTDLARTLRWAVYHPWLSVRSTPGFPDLVLVRPPRLLFIELKTDRGTLTPHQADWLELFSRCPPAEAHCIRPADWERLVALLR